MATVNYSWTLPTVGASVNTWGTLLNTIIDDIDAKMVSKTAPVFTGGMTLSGGASITGNSTVTGTLGVISDSVDGSQLKITGATNQNYQTRVGFDTTNLLGKIQAIHVGTAYKDLVLQPDGGNLGLGVTPKAWNTGLRAIQVGYSASIDSPTSVANTRWSNNAFIDSGGGFKYINTAVAQVYEQDNNGKHIWYTAPSGTAGNAISFGDPKMTLDASGKLGVNCIPAYRFHVSESTGSAYTARFDNTHASQPYGLSVLFSAASPNNTTNTFLICSDNTADKLRIYSNGNVVNTLNSYGAISDLKLKQDITDATPKLAKLLKVHIVNYKFKADPDGIKQIGVIAQELEEISPGLIEETPDFEDVILTREVEKTVPVTVKKEVTTELVRLEVIDGVAVQKVIRETAVIDEPVVDEYPVFDGDGNPVMEVVADAAGDAPAVLRQKIHTVPRMETVVDKEEYTERRLTGTTTKSVKYSIFVPMLIKALQEHVEETRTGFALRDETIKALTARIEALEARA